MKIGTNELIIILIVVIVIFGPTQIPKLAKMFGKSAKNFKAGLDADDDEDDAPKAKKAKKTEAGKDAETSDGEED